MDAGLQRRELLVGGAGFVSAALAGCGRGEGDYNALVAFCLSCSDTPGECDNEPIPSDEEPVASSETLQALLDAAVDEIDFADCDPGGVERGPPLHSDETWDDVAAVYESLPHGDIRHDGYVVRVHYADERPKE